MIAPDGLTLARLDDDPGPDHHEARDFCLAVIKEFYDFDYRPDWHVDLDSLTWPAEANHYAGRNRGAFWLLRGGDGALVATAGIRGLGWKPQLLAEFAERYGEGDRVASLWRVYVRRDRRRHGLGRWLGRLAEQEAAAMGYRTMYLHASSDAAATIAFWHAAGYQEIGESASSTHFDKALA